MYISGEYLNQHNFEIRGYDYAHDAWCMIPLTGYDFQGAVDEALELAPHLEPNEVQVWFDNGIICCYMGYCTRAKYGRWHKHGFTFELWQKAI